MKKQLLFGLSLLLILSSCVKNKGTISLTYNKATAVYGDIEEIRNTPLIGSVRSIENSGKIYVGKDYLLIGEKNVGIHVFDNTDPNAPINVSFINLPFTEEFAVSDDMIYAESHYDMVKIDLSDMYNPVLVDRAEYAFGAPIENNKGEVLLGFNYAITTESFELESPEAQALESSSYLYYNYMEQLIPESEVPSSFAGSFEESKGTLNKIAVHHSHVYVLGSRELFTFEDTPTELIPVNIASVGSEMETIFPQNDNLFIGTRFSMIVMSISSPSMPMYVSEYNHPTSCDPVYPNGSYAYLTLRTADFSGCSGDENTLEVLDISNVSYPFTIQSLPMISPYGMALIDEKLYVGEGINGLAIFDASNPSSLTSIGHESVQAYDIMKHPTRADIILTTGDNGLDQYQVNTSGSATSLQFLSSINY